MGRYEVEAVVGAEEKEKRMGDMNGLIDDYLRFRRNRAATDA